MFLLAFTHALLAVFVSHSGDVPPVGIVYDLRSIVCVQDVLAYDNAIEFVQMQGCTGDDSFSGACPFSAYRLVFTLRLLVYQHWVVAARHNAAAS